MTAVEEKPETATATGRVVRVIGPVVDVEFGRDTIPALNQARQAEITQEISEIVGGADALAAAGSDE